MSVGHFMYMDLTSEEKSELKFCVCDIQAYVQYESEVECTSSLRDIVEIEKMSNEGHGHGIVTTQGASRRRLRSNHVNDMRETTGVYPGRCQES